MGEKFGGSKPVIVMFIGRLSNACSAKAYPAELGFHLERSEVCCVQNMF